LVEDDDFEYDEFDDFYDDDELEDEVISFLNEYYLININILPPSEFF
jgi:hypothetical protein